MKPHFRKSFLTILLIIYPILIFAQVNKYDITNYHLLIKPDFNSKAIELKASVTIDNPNLDSSFTFGLNDNYSKVEVYLDQSPVTFERKNGWITVNLKKRVKSFVLNFILEGKPGRSSGEKRNVIEGNSLFLLWSDRFYPIDFSDWATVKTTLILPDNFLAIAPGKEISAVKENDKVKYVFQSNVPDANYSVFADTRWVKREREINGIKMQTLLYPESQKFSDQIFNTSSKVLHFFSKTLYPYPFEQFSFVTITGMYARRAFSGFVGYTPEYLEKEFTTTGFDAHETSLLWWGHIITGGGSGGWQWIEGFGDYSEIYFDLLNNKPIPKIFTYFRKKYLESDLSKDFLYSELRGNTRQEFIHGKYPWLMHFLRYRLGDKKFNNALHFLFRKYKFRTVSIDEFLSALEQGSGEALSWFKNEWLNRRGVPVISFNYKISELKKNKYKIICNIEQSGNVYSLPLEIGIKTKNGLKIEKVNFNKREMSYTFSSNEKPEKIMPDPNNRIIMKIIKN